MPKQNNDPWKERPGVGVSRDGRMASGADASSQGTERVARDGDPGTETASGETATGETATGETATGETVTGGPRLDARDDGPGGRELSREELAREKIWSDEPEGSQETDVQVLRQLVDEKRRSETRLQRRYPAIRCSSRIPAGELTFGDALMMAAVYAFVNSSQGVGEIHGARNAHAMSLEEDWPVLPVVAMLDENREGPQVWPCTYSARGILSGWMRARETGGGERRRLTVPGFLWKRGASLRSSSLPENAYWWTTPDGRTDLFGVDHLLCVGGEAMAPYACHGSHIEAVALAEEVAFRIGETAYFPERWLDTVEEGVEELMVGEVQARTRQKLEIEGYDEMEPTFGRARRFIQKAVWQASPAQVSVVLSLLITGMEALNGKKDMETGEVLGAKDLFLEALDEVERAVDERRITWPRPEVYSLSGEIQACDSLASRVVQQLCQEGSVLHLTVPEIAHCIRSS